MKATKEIEKETNKCKIFKIAQNTNTFISSAEKQKIIMILANITGLHNNETITIHHSFISQITKKASQLLICARAEVLCFSTEALRQLM